MALPTFKLDLPRRYTSSFGSTLGKSLQWAFAWFRVNSPANMLRTLVSLTDTAQTVTADNMINSGILVITPSTGRAITTPTAAQLQDAYPLKNNGVVAIGESFEFSLISLAAQAATLTPGANVTIVGSAVANNASATFKAVFDSATTVKIYRI